MPALVEVARNTKTATANNSAGLVYWKGSCLRTSLFSFCADCEREAGLLDSKFSIRYKAQGIGYKDFCTRQNI